MFDFGRDLKRLFGVDAGAPSRAAAHRGGLTGGDTSLLELLSNAGPANCPITSVVIVLARAEA